MSEKLTAYVQGYGDLPLALPSSAVAVDPATNTTYVLFSAGGGGGGVASSVALNDNATPTHHATIDASGHVYVLDENSVAILTALQGVLSVKQPTSNTSAITQVPAALTDTALLAANASRKCYKIFNKSTGNLYLAENSAVSAISFTLEIAAGAYYESTTSPIWTGAVHGLWDLANGDAYITEES